MLLKKVFIIFSSILGIRCIHAGTEAGMPLIHISHDELGEDYPEMREEVHLEDFFWTGSGDGPPDYLKKVHTGISKGKEVIVKTETVVATVYVDGNNEIDIPICLDCPPDDGGGSTWGNGNIPPLNYSATDRRYWLLTVMSGFYTQKDNPSLEEKLARLYRLAFTRQQSKHLGINGAQQIFGVSVPTTGKERQTREHGNDYEILDMTTRNHTPPIRNEPPLIESRTYIHSELDSSSEETDFISSTSTAFTSSTTEQPEVETTNASEEPTVDPTPIATSMAWELIQNGDDTEKLNKLTHVPLNLKLLRLQQHFPYLKDDRVRVVIHNLTQITEDNIQNGRVPGLYDMDVNEKIEERPVANQTELIYSVFVNGRPVMAVTAANDMRLVTEAEVADVIGKDVFMKAEPYLREPQATPLAPATRSGSIGFIDSLQNNPALVIVSSLAILLLLLLLVALLLMGRSHVRQKNNEANRTSSRNDLLSDTQSPRLTSSVTALDTSRSVQSRDVGVQNLSFEEERTRGGGARSGAREAARIHFPGPPEYERTARRDSITSSDNTSDSSIYCPINPPNVGVQRMLDEKAATLFDAHRKRHHHHQYDRAEGHERPVYTAVVSEKSRSKNRLKTTKRKYLSENRVGSLESSPAQRNAHSSGEDVVTDYIDDDESFRASYENFERAETALKHSSNNYHRNKLLHQKSMFTDPKNTGYDEQDTPEAINKEIIRALQPTNRKSSDTGSIGSFLSMASVKAFPKNPLPEPLNKVLEPVFVTYYDNVEDQHCASAKVPARTSSAKSQVSQRKHMLHHLQYSSDAATIATIESFPSPKAPTGRNSLSNTQSDNPDPGVIGPIVWERHKKRLSDDNAESDSNLRGAYNPYSPIRDPAAMRNHYEGLLEGAMQMYSSQDDLPMPLPTRDFTNSRRPTKREFRGSSAGASSYSTTKAYKSSDRPSTAQAEKSSFKSNQSTEPPSPTSGAWGGSINDSNSPLVRPLSAGPFHRPDQKLVKIFPKSATSQRGQPNAAPLVEALQNELRKYNNKAHK